MTDDQLDQLDYYTLLAVEPTASVREIRRAFRRFARKYHPDRFAGASEAKIERANQIYRRGSEAVQTLADPLARKGYDAFLPKGKTRLRADERDRVKAVLSGKVARKARKEPAIHSPQAQAFYKKAGVIARSGDFRAARHMLQTALQLEPENEVIKKRLQQLEAKIRGV